MKKNKNIFPTNLFIPKKEKENRLKQSGKVLWLTGLSGSGKTTIAAELEKHLWKKGFFTQVLDADNIRSGINNNLGFSEKDRTENIRRVAEIARMFCDCGVITICSFISPTNAMRTLAKKIIGKENFILVFVNTPMEVCEIRDTKGLYEKAKTEKLKNFTGVNAVFEIPAKPDITVNTVELSLNECVERIVRNMKYEI